MIPRVGLRIGLLIAGVITLVACRGDGWVALTVGEQVLRVQIAADPDARERGLMYRRTLGEEEGMLFVFPDAGLRSFWMKDTPLPLSLAYINEHGRILEIHEMTPFSLQSVRSRYPARFALEVNRGAFARLGIAVGDSVDLKPLSAFMRRSR